MRHRQTSVAIVKKTSCNTGSQCRTLHNAHVGRYWGILTNMTNKSGFRPKNPVEMLCFTKWEINSAGNKSLQKEEHRSIIREGVHDRAGNNSFLRVTKFTCRERLSSWSIVLLCHNTSATPTGYNQSPTLSHWHDLPGF